MRKLTAFLFVATLIVFGFVMHNTASSIMPKSTDIRDYTLPEGKPLAASPMIYTHVIQIEKTKGNASSNIEVGKFHRVFLSDSQITELNSTGSTCIDSMIVVQLPETSSSDLDARMRDCNPNSSVAATAY